MTNRHLLLWEEGKRILCDLKKGCSSKPGAQRWSLYANLYGNQKHAGRKVIKPWSFPCEIQCLCNHSEGLRTDGNKEHKRTQRGTHHDGEFCIGDPGPTPEPFYTQATEEQLLQSMKLKMANLSGSNYQSSSWALGIVTEHECKLEELFLENHMWASTEVKTSRATFLRWGPGLGWTTFVQWYHRAMI